MAAKKTNAEKAKDAIDRALKGLKKDQRERVLSNYVQTETKTRTVKVEEPNEHVDELRRVYAAYRAGSESLRAVESVVRKVVA